MLIEILIIIATFAIIFRYYSLSHWKRKNVFHIPGDFFFGSVKDLLLQRKTLREFFNEIYDEHKSQKVIGFYGLYRPMLIVNDPDLIHSVLVKDFNKFHNNGFRVHIEVDPMMGINPFPTPGLQRWKNVRSLHLPLLTPMKLKEYVQYMIKVGENMTHFLKSKKCEPLLVRTLASCITIDNVASCAYGCEPTAFTNPECGFIKHASHQFFTPSKIANIGALMYPALPKLLGLRVISKESQDFFVSMVKSVIETRTKYNVKKNDIIGHLMELNKKQLDQNKPGFTELEMAGHSATFYVDGFETSSSQLSFQLIELANRPDVQEKIRDEIFSFGEKFEDFDYDKVNSMPYLAMVLDETLRMHPLIPVLSREATDTVQLGDITIEKGTKVFIPVICIQRDPKYFPNPLEFIPERFSEENKDSVIKYSYLPFGEGPRKCLGFRFAKLQLKLALIYILMHFLILPGSNEEKEEIIYERDSPFVMNPSYETTLRFKLIK